jgi:hypothetical protein
MNESKQTDTIRNATSVEKGVSLSEKLSHYDNVRQDVRDELKMRITQRDNFAIQYVVVLGTVIAGAFAGTYAGAFEGTYYALLLMPMISIYFTTQILYSYFMHNTICYFLRENIEKKIIEILNDNPPLSEWESFVVDYQKKSKITIIGIRKDFFIVCMWAITLLSESFAIALIYDNDKLDLNHILPISITFLLYLSINAIITYNFVFNAKKGEKNYNNQRSAHI